LLTAWHSKTRGPLTILEPETFTGRHFLDQFLQASIFDPGTLFIVNIAGNGNSYLDQILKLSNRKTENRLIVCLQGKPTAKVIKDAKLNGSVDFIDCPEPAPFEVTDFISFQARRSGLKLTSGAVKLIAECLGKDLRLIANELQRLHYIFLDSNKPLDEAQLAPYLGLLKEELVFKLRNHILEQKLGAAEALLTHLMKRGESSLAVLGFLAKHTRSAVAVAESLNNGDNPNEIARKSHLQKYLITGYTRYVRQLGISKLMLALQQCIAADRRLKSERIDGQILLSEIVQTLVSSRG
jgi:DNA polymerase III delta subunit